MPIPTASARSFRPGGELRVGVLGDPGIGDPQADIGPVALELGRCCLLRTLFSYNGRPAGEGGGDPQLDLAAAPPSVSADGLTWTFRIKPGIPYAPPLQAVEITAGDFLRSMEREVVLKRDYGTGIEVFFLQTIAGAQEFADGKADGIAGMEAPDAHTLVVHLLKPAGDLPYLFALPVSAPIPPNPTDPRARYGVAEGHDGDYQNFLVASGPYMIEGSERLDFSRPPKQQVPASGFTDASLTLVRNPSWQPATDPLRKAFVDRIVVVGAGDDPGQAAKRVAAGAVDVILDPFASLSSDLLKRYRATNGVQVFTTQGSTVTTMSMNVAVPPFDDIHVRRAVNFAIDKQALASLWQRNRGPVELGTHLGADSLEDNILTSYDPYGPNPLGNPSAARKEMALSHYDQNGDGRCDGSACTGVVVVTRNDPPFFAQMASVIGSDLAGIGISIRIEAKPLDVADKLVFDPSARIAMSVGDSWGPFYPSGSNIFPSFFLSQNIDSGCCNISLIGATPAQLRHWGYTVTSVPTVDDRIDTCIPMAFRAQVQCWAEFDQYMMEEVSAWVPLFFKLTVLPASDRVRNFSFDLFTLAPALDQIALAGA